MWRELLPIGRNADTGGYRRYAWTEADAGCRAWFRAQAEARGLRYETDRNGNQWAWLGDPDAGDAVVTGSHLDSVPDGGAFDGPLGVVSAFAALDELRVRGARPSRPLAVVNFGDEEGARFGLACVGSRLAAGQLEPERARALRDADGITLAQAMKRAGYDPDAIGPDPERLARIGAFVELHLEQGRTLATLPDEGEGPAPGGPGAATWPDGSGRPGDGLAEAAAAGSGRDSGAEGPGTARRPGLGAEAGPGAGTGSAGAGRHPGPGTAPGTAAGAAEAAGTPGTAGAAPGAEAAGPAGISGPAGTAGAAVPAGPAGAQVGARAAGTAGPAGTGSAGAGTPGAPAPARTRAPAGQAVGVASAIWPHGRWRFDFHGEANHAGTTRIDDRRDPMLTYATTVLAARKKARLAGALATFGKVAVEPNGVNAIPSLVRGWLDCRAPDEETLAAVVAAIEQAAAERGRRDGVAVRVTRESFTPVTDFAHGLRDRLAVLLGGAPVLPTGAGHDAGILSASVPTAMLFVRNPTGVSHSPAESADEDDCLAGVTALADVLEALACR
ncbi:Zn-dependent hydrolase [Streptomyces sp. B1866]|uniref:Zn-dependent hydrolase n=1 Tax=Streptomyces sp. B1866 TaxID=3075431 RepID=UPI00288DF822|nr:Zn-dependent hydrolase [Streptomyces sp. B1866]MDT3395845.1 Zn-dependent hydrolase [Streptomyces sp. B1866]